ADGLVSLLFSFLALLIWLLCPFAILKCLLSFHSISNGNAGCRYLRQPGGLYLLADAGFLLVFSVSSVGSCCHKLTELMSYHILGNVYRHVFSSIMDSDCMSYE